MRWILFLIGFVCFAVAGFVNGLMLFSAQESQPECVSIQSGYGPAGPTPLKIEKIVTGLEVPWAMASLPSGAILVTERSGRVRLVEKGKLISKPVLELSVQDSGEGGLLGLAVHPEFKRNNWIYVYYTLEKNGSTVNRIERYKLAKDYRSAKPDRVIVDDLPGAELHNGGRIHFGPDRMLYVGTGDATDRDSAQNVTDMAGKILRISPDGGVPQVFAYGLRNPQGFIWISPTLLAVVDHGPSGELGRRGHDELNWVRNTENFGWPTIYGCQQARGMHAPAISWTEAMPPSSVVLYTGSAIPEWKGSLLITTLGSELLERVLFESGNPPKIVGTETYLSSYGRLRDILQTKDGSLLIATSNCDGRGTCPAEKDSILRVTRKE